MSAYFPFVGDADWGGGGGGGGWGGEENPNVILMEILHLDIV